MKETRTIGRRTGQIAPSEMNPPTKRQKALKNIALLRL
jgi:hypothetical protein